MKNHRNTFFCLTLLSLLVFGFSCQKEDPLSKDPTIAANQKINSWILDSMQIFYLWNDQMPAKVDKTLNPNDFFKSLLYKDDRFSWIQENFTDLLDMLSGVQMEAGYDFTLMRLSSDSQDVIGIINYVKPNSPASNTELKRGNLFNSINGTKLTLSNYGDVLNGLSSQHTLGIVEIQTNPLKVVPVKDIKLSVIKFAENPVLLDTTYTIAGKKIGYLVYNFFAEDNRDNTQTYAKELNSIFGQFKSTGINELILDLRYNGGGAITTCTKLSSMISNRGKNDVFGITQYNSLLDKEFKKQMGADYNKTYFVDNIGSSVSINKLTNLSRLFVITSNRTASASEDLINGLKAYMSVILVGDTTYGKNVGSITIYEEDTEKQKTNKWGLQPIVVKFANAKNFSDFGNGFVPDVLESEYSYFPLFPLGDINETLLQTTLIKMGVANAPVLRTYRENTVIPIYSSMDRTSVRRNAILPAIKK